MPTKQELEEKVDRLTIEREELISKLDKAENNEELKRLEELNKELYEEKSKLKKEVSNLNEDLELAKSRVSDRETKLAQENEELRKKAQEIIQMNDSSESELIPLYKAMSNIQNHGFKADKEMQLTKEGNAKTKYLSLDSIIPVIGMELGKAGHYMIQSLTDTKITTFVRNENNEDVIVSEEFDFTEFIKMADYNGKRHWAQHVGAIMTYIKRYQVCALFGIVVETDLDSQLKEEAKKEDKEKQQLQRQIDGLKLQLPNDMQQEFVTVASGCTNATQVMAQYTNFVNKANAQAQAQSSAQANTQESAPNEELSEEVQELQNFVTSKIKDSKEWMSWYKGQNYNDLESLKEIKKIIVEKLGE